MAGTCVVRRKKLYGLVWLGLWMYKCLSGNPWYSHREAAHRPKLHCDSKKRHSAPPSSGGQSELANAPLFHISLVTVKDDSACTCFYYLENQQLHIVF